jgi:hypothetical protein
MPVDGKASLSTIAAPAEAWQAWCILKAAAWCPSLQAPAGSPGFLRPRRAHESLQSILLQAAPSSWEVRPAVEDALSMNFALRRRVARAR